MLSGRFPCFREEKMRILLIRHGEPDYSGDSLTPKGRTEAELLSRRMEKYQIRDFYVSPLGRARLTAEYTLKRMGREAEVLPWLQEFRAKVMDIARGRVRGAWDRMPREWEQYPESFDPERWTEIPPYQGSDVRQIWEETKAGVDELLARYGFRKDGPVWITERNSMDTIALFCHFGISMAILAYLTDISPLVCWQRMLCAPSSVTEIVTEERVQGEVAFRITKLGDIAHLEMNGEPRSTHGLFPECYTGVDSTDPTQNNAPTRQGP